MTGGDIDMPCMPAETMISVLTRIVNRSFSAIVVDKLKIRTVYTDILQDENTNVRRKRTLTTIREQTYAAFKPGRQILYRLQRC